ncbi:hypothetical protein GCM10020001_054020 [Nonomuraea salmonea]
MDEDGRLYAVGQAQLGQHAADVGLDRGLRQAQLAADLRVGQAAGQGPDDVLLPAGQPGELPAGGLGAGGGARSA